MRLYFFRFGFPLRRRTIVTPTWIVRERRHRDVHGPRGGPERAADARRGSQRERRLDHTPTY